MISVVICSITPDRYAETCDNLSRLIGPEPHEFVGIHDATSIAEAYNRGVRKARGELLILCHDDIEILAPDFLERLTHRLKWLDLVGIAGSNRVVGPKWVNAGPPHIFGQVAHYIPTEKCYDVQVWGAPAPCVEGIKIMDGLFLAGPRHLFRTVRFDQETFTGFHLYDLDFTFRASQQGFKLGVCMDLMVIHHSVGNFENEWLGFAEKFVHKHHAHFDPGPIHRWQAKRVKVDRKEHLPDLLRSPYWPDWRAESSRDLAYAR